MATETSCEDIPDSFECVAEDTEYVDPRLNFRYYYVKNVCFSLLMLLMVTIIAVAVFLTVLSTTASKLQDYVNVIILDNNETLIRYLPDVVYRHKIYPGSSESTLLIIEVVPILGLLMLASYKSFKRSIEANYFILFVIASCYGFDICFQTDLLKYSFSKFLLAIVICTAVCVVILATSVIVFHLLVQRKIVVDITMTSWGIMMIIILILPIHSFLVTFAPELTNADSILVYTLIFFFSILLIPVIQCTTNANYEFGFSSKGKHLAVGCMYSIVIHMFFYISYICYLFN